MCMWNKILLIFAIFLLFSCSYKDTAGLSKIDFEQFLIEPYLTDVGDDYVELNWVLNVEGVSVIEYGKTLDFGSTLYFDSSVVHNFTLDDLDFDSTYYYRVNNSFSSSFKTSIDNDNFSFVAVGHTSGTRPMNFYPQELVSAVMGELKSDFFVSMGDISYFSSYEGFSSGFFSIFDDLISSIPVFVAPGNHDAGWPFIGDGYGVDLSRFCSLFNYESLSEYCKDDVFYYVKDLGNIQLVFFSYVLNDFKNIDVLFDRLRKVINPDKFNIIVYGGGNETFYDKPGFFEFFNEIDVDLVLNGDGGGVKFYDYENIPVYMLGTRGENVQSFLYARYIDPYISLLEVDAMNQILFSNSFLAYNPSKNVKDLPLDYTVRFLEKHSIYNMDILLNDELSNMSKYIILNVDLPKSSKVYVYFNYKYEDDKIVDLRTQSLLGKSGNNILVFRVLDLYSNFDVTGELFSISLGFILDEVSGSEIVLNRVYFAN